MKRGSVIIMKSREMYAADKIPRIAFYIVLAVIAAAFIIAEMVYPSERTQESQSKNLLVPRNFCVGEGRWIQREDRGAGRVRCAGMCSARRM